jgi:hypothetical protein
LNLTFHSEIIVADAKTLGALEEQKFNSVCRQMCSKSHVCVSKFVFPLLYGNSLASLVIAIKFRFPKRRDGKKGKDLIFAQERDKNNSACPL